MGDVVLITGSSSGIGQEIAYSFSRKGYSVVITYFLDKDRKDGLITQKRCMEMGAESTLLLQLDLLKDSSIKKVISAVKRKYGKIDVLVNNAGILVKKSFKRHTTREIELEVRTNLEGLIKMTYLSLPIVKKWIVNIASRRGVLVIPDACVYGATKWGVRGFTKDLALEYPKLKIACVNPSLTATKITKYEGMEPWKVAAVVLGTVEGKHKVENGGDVNVWEVYGIPAV